MSVQFERAFDSLIASHDVSDEAIDRLYDGGQEVTPLEIRYGLLCGSVPPVNMKGFTERAAERQKKSKTNAEYYARCYKRQQEAAARDEAERRRRREEEADNNGHNDIFEQYSPMIFVPQKKQNAHSVSKPSKVLTPQEIIECVKLEFLKITVYAQREIEDLEINIDTVCVTDKILNTSHDDARAEAIRDLNQLEVDFRDSDGAGWKSVVNLINSGDITTKQQAIDYAHSFKSEAKKSRARYLSRLSGDVKKAKERASGTMDDKYNVWHAYRDLTIRMMKRPILYIMKIMCESIGNSDMYDIVDRSLVVPLGEGVQFWPKQFTKIEPEEYHTPLAILWAMNTIADSTYNVISYRTIQDYYKVHSMNSSDMLYIGYGMHCLSCEHGKVKPALVYKFRLDNKFPESCKIIYTNEMEMKKRGEADPAAKSFYMEKYFHERNVRYASFDIDDVTDSLEDLAIEIAVLSTTTLAQYKGGTQ